jgi:nucleoside-diphosphate-sugar epimerase
MRILVTGGEGLVGSAVVAHLLESGHDVTTLSLPGSTPHEAVRVVRGDTRDADVVAAAVRDVDAVAHLAAIPSPWDDPAPVVFGNNTLGTFTVLWTAAEQGVRRFAIASSVNAAGLLMNPDKPQPPYFPIDEDIPPDLADPYSLSKQTDEHTLRAVCRRFGAAGVAFRLPLMVSDENAAELHDWQAARPAETLGDGWGWLHVRDGAQAFRLAVTAADLHGAHVVHVAARDTIQDVPTEDLIARYAPGVPRTEKYPGRTAPIDTRRATALLGFVPRLGDPSADWGS